MDTIAQLAGERWEFRCDHASGGWRWEHRARDSVVVAASTRAFHTLDGAVSDAVASGFTYVLAVHASEPDT